jgi:hypothetical protein
MHLPRRFPRRLSVAGALAISTLVGLFFAVNSMYSISLGAPPKLKPRTVSVALAATHVLVDAPHSLITNPKAGAGDFEAYSKRATLYSDLIDSPPARALIAQRAGIPLEQLTTRSRLTAMVQDSMRDPDFEQRANQLLVAKLPYKLEFQADPSNPILNIYAQAPTSAQADRLADAAVTGLRDYLADFERKNAVPNQIVLQQLGAARGSVVNKKIEAEIVLLSFLVPFGVCLGGLFAVAGIRRGWKAAGRPDEAQPGEEAAPRARWAGGGSWPRTTRVQPWLFAGFLVILWLVPFNSIQLGVTLPIDAKLDRLVLPLLFAVWVFALAVGGPASPRVRMTLIHVGIFGFVAAASLSVFVNAHDLNRTLEYDLAFKKITLLLSYVLLFVIVASSLRRDEVQAFLKYNLVLAVLSALGTIYEYRFHYNIFYHLSDAVLPGIFQVDMRMLNAVDDIGRPMTIGASEHPLEAAGMMTMAIPIALVGLMHSTERRQRILYTLAACILLAAAISTYRKTALLGPVAGVLTIAYFRRRELLRLAPLGFAALAVIHVLSPGALGSVLFQLKPSRLGVATVSDRASDYDAVRPDLWSHLVFGRGYGSYDHNSYRILDSEMLNRVVDTGIVGTLALVLMIVCIVFAARGVINSRHPVTAPIALMVAASAVSFLVLTFLFDVSSFPHVPYLLMVMVGLLAVVLSSEQDEPVPRPPARSVPVVSARARERELAGISR